MVATIVALIGCCNDALVVITDVININTYDLCSRNWQFGSNLHGYAIIARQGAPGAVADRRCIATDPPERLHAIVAVSYIQPLTMSVSGRHHGVINAPQTPECEGASGQGGPLPLGKCNTVIAHMLFSAGNIKILRFCILPDS